MTIDKKKRRDNEEICLLRKDVVERFYSLMCSQIKKAISSDSQIEDELAFDYIEATLHALFDYYERIDGEKISGETKKKLDALRLANNKLKHSVCLGRGAILSSKFIFPIMLPMNLSKNFVWGDLSDSCGERKQDAQLLELYKEYLYKKDIRCTFRNILNEINEELTAYQNESACFTDSLIES